MTRELLCLLLLAAGLPSTLSKLARGEVDLASRKWAFTERFCFASTNGRYDYTISFDLFPSLNVTLGSNDFPSLLFYTSFDQFRAVDTPAVPCIDRVMAAQQTVALQPLANLKCSSTQRGLGISVTCTGGWDLLPASTPQWWLAVVHCCACAAPPLLTYTQQFRNGNERTTREFSYDEYGMLPISAVFFVVNALLTVLINRFQEKLEERLAEPYLFRLLKYSAMLRAAGVMFELIYFAEYARTGEPVSIVLPLGWFLESCSMGMFVYLLLLIAKGVTITRPSMSPDGRVKNTIIFWLWFIPYIVFVMLSTQLRDDIFFLERRDTAPGSVSLGLHIVACLWFSFAVFTTDARPQFCPQLHLFGSPTPPVEMTQRHRRFYVRVFSFFWVWLISSPLAIWCMFGLRLFTSSLLTSGTVASWTGPPAASAIEQSVYLAGLIFLTHIFRPSEANKNFPFRTSTDRPELQLDSLNTLTVAETILGVSHPLDFVVETVQPAAQRSPSPVKDGPTPSPTPTSTRKASGPSASASALGPGPGSNNATRSSPGGSATSLSLPPPALLPPGQQHVGLEDASV
eukprot:m.134662 g.134662  ORF g.134662 m.134662 type:complete len:571 (+) comp14850_c0_seq7:217-1929(+)